MTAENVEFGRNETNRTNSEDNAPSVERVRKIAFDLFYEMDDLEGPNQDRFCSALAQALYDAELLYDEARDVAICADVAFARRHARRAESRYNTLREALEELCAGSEPMILAWEDPANPIAAPVECVAVIDLRALLSKDGNDGT